MGIEPQSNRENSDLFRSIKASILVVDDEKRIRDGCSSILAKEGFNVQTAESGYDALKALETHYFDIILLDLMMPGISGMEILSHVKAADVDTVIIVITGYATVENSIAAMKRGAFDFISKPFSPDDLRLVISKAIEYIQTLQDIVHEKSRMRALINCLSDAVMATDRSKRVALANQAFLKTIGYQGREFIGKPARQLLLNDELDEMIDEALAMPKGEFNELTREITYRPLGETEESVLLARCVPFRDKVGRNLGTITVLQDITAIKRMNQMKSELVSMVSHEIRGPLNTVLMQVKLVSDGLAGQVTEKQKELLVRMSDRLKSLVKLSSELLDLAKIESGLINQEREVLQMADILEDQVAFFQTRAEGKKIKLNLLPIPDLTPVLANRANMEEVLSNLLSNAIKYTQENGTVTIRAAESHGYLCIEVSDTGIGIEKEEQDHILQRFYRVKNDKTRFIPGTGLGLAIVNSIVRAHHGRITLDSEFGKGSTFRVYLPFAPQ